MSTIDYAHYWFKGIDFATYVAEFKTVVAENTNLPKEERIKYFEFYPVNLHRLERIYNQYNPAEVLDSTLAVTSPVYWLVLTEHWCGDASQNLPVLAKIADSSNGLIQLKVLYRDENMPLMDAHLTDGGRAIPKLIQLNQQFEVMGTWGPRPKDAQLLSKDLKANNTPFEQATAILHKWYATNATRQLTAEIKALLQFA